MRLAIMTVLTSMFLLSCVTGRQYSELEAKKNAVEEENAKLLSANEQLTSKTSELESKNDVLTKEIEGLRSDTTLLGNSLRHLRTQYDKINELNDILDSKNSKMMREVADENKQLLADLEKAQENLQSKEDALLKLETEIDEKQSNLEKLSADLSDREAKVKELQDLIAKKDAAVNELRDKVAQALLGFKDKGLTVEQKNGKVYVSLEANLLFPSGSTSINNEGKQALIDLAKAIEDQADLEIIVEGHTDTDKISRSTSPVDNWELSVLRATSVVKIMMANSQVKPDILTASGRSEYHPVDPEDKSKNRRIEIILSPNLNELYNLING